MQLEAVQHGAAQREVAKREFAIQGAKIVSYESGQGAPVLFLHGSPDTHDMWLPLMELLNDQVRCIAPDLPGFGDSTLPDNFSLTLDNMADFIRDLVTAMNLNEPVTLVTTDFGGHYGLAFLVKYPHLVRGISISNTNFFHDYDWHFFAKLYRLPVIGDILIASAGSSRSMLSDTLKKAAPALPDSYIESSFDSGFGSASVRKTILRMYRSRASKDFVGWEDKLVALLKEKPAIVLWGDKDPFITPNYADRFGNAKVKVHHFKEYSHWLPLEAPDQVADVLRGWLKTL